MVEIPGVLNSVVDNQEDQIGEGVYRSRAKNSRMESLVKQSLTSIQRWGQVLRLGYFESLVGAFISKLGSLRGA